MVIRIVCNCVVVFHHIKISGTDSHALLLGLGGAVGECEGGVVWTLLSNTPEYEFIGGKQIGEYSVGYNPDEVNPWLKWLKGM